MKNFSSTLGLCAKAGKLVFGVPAVCDALPTGRVLLIVEAGDTSEGTHKRLEDKSAFYGARKIRVPLDGAELAAAVGKTGVLGACGVTDASLASLVLRSFET